MIDFFRKDILTVIYKKLKNIYNDSEVVYPKPLQIQSTDKILVLAPHADDESIGCGGLLLKYAEQCEVVCITNCKTGNPKKSFNDNINERRTEFESAMDYATIKNIEYILNIDSDNLQNSYKEFCNTLNSRDLSLYTFIAIPIFYDQHPDHIALVKHLNKYVKNIKFKRTNILFYEVWSTIYVPNKFIDLSNCMEQKCELIAKYKSQIDYIDYVNKIKNLNSYRGMIVGKEFSEMYLEISIKKFKELEL